MPRDLDLKRRLELAGLTVIEVDGWKTRGKDDLNAVGSVHHHTGGAVGKTAPSLGVVINGRSDLPGPLCNVYGARTEDLAVHLIAAGKANHAGAGGWHGHSGNASVYGLEEEHSGGPNEPVTEHRIDRMARVHAAFAFGRFTADEVCQHREWAPTRKPDFTIHHLDADDFRRRVAAHLLRMGDPTQEDDMPLDAEDKAFIADRSFSNMDRQELHDINTVGQNVERRVAAMAITVTKALDIDEAELAKQLAPLINDSLSTLDTADLERIAEAVADELAERAKD